MEDLETAAPGYQLDSNESNCYRISPLSVRVLRLILHISMLFSGLLSRENVEAIRCLIHAENTEIDPFSFLLARVSEDWKKLRTMTDLGHGDLFVGIVSVVERFLKYKPVTNAIVLTNKQRTMEEQVLQEHIEAVFCDNNYREHLANQRNELEGESTVSAIQLTTGKKLWDDINEVLPLDDKKNPITPSLSMLLWRIRQPVSYQHFVLTWNLQSASERASFPLLSTLVKEESRLKNIRGICDILAWQKILFQVIPHMSISRTEAIDLTNGEAISRLPVEEQENAKAIFSRFCETFNSVLPNFEKLYECDDNPFLVNGKVDFGGGKQMDEETCVAFSLPSMVTGSDAGNFINGICTIRILESLVDSQNDILEAIHHAELNRRKRHVMQENNAASAFPEPPQEREIPNVPAVSYLTPIEVLQRQVIVYNRENDFLPVLRVFSNQSLEYQKGGELFYNFEKIESTLANGLLAGKRPINLCISHFQYRGDVQLMGQLDKLNKKLPQDVHLSNHIKESIEQEIDTQNHALLFLQLLELSIQFIISIGSSSDQILNGDLKLSEFIIDTMGLQEKWTNVKTPSISQHIRLRNIQSLYMMLESLLKGNVLDEIPGKYCETISEEQDLLLRKSVSGMNLQVLIAELRDFIGKAIIRGGYGPECDLKAFLASTNLGEEPWFNKHFPEGFNLAHTKSIYNLFASLEQ